MTASSRKNYSGSSISFAYSVNGLITSATDASSRTAHTFAYDNLNRLITEDTRFTGVSGTLTQSWGYDLASNVTSYATGKNGSTLFTNNYTYDGMVESAHAGENSMVLRDLWRPNASGAAAAVWQDYPTSHPMTWPYGLRHGLHSRRRYRGWMREDVQVCSGSGCISAPCCAGAWIESRFRSGVFCHAIPRMVTLRICTGSRGM